MVLDVVRIPRPALPHPGPKPGVKVDARSERWREHRKKVRSEIVEAAFRAIDRLGPDLSVREIAEEAGTAKPKIYRHFTDKSDLFQAIGRLRHRLGPRDHQAQRGGVRQPGRRASQRIAVLHSGSFS